MDLISIMVPLEVVANIINIIIYVRCIKHNLVGPNHECERGCAVLVEHIYVFFLSLYIFEKIVLDLVLKVLDTDALNVLNMLFMENNFEN